MEFDERELISSREDLVEKQGIQVPLEDPSLSQEGVPDVNAYETNYLPAFQDALEGRVEPVQEPVQEQKPQEPAPVVDYDKRIQEMQNLVNAQNQSLMDIQAQNLKNQEMMMQFMENMNKPAESSYEDEDLDEDEKRQRALDLKIKSLEDKLQKVEENRKFSEEQLERTQKINKIQQQAAQAANEVLFNGKGNVSDEVKSQATNHLLAYAASVQAHPKDVAEDYKKFLDSYTGKSSADDVSKLEQSAKMTPFYKGSGPAPKVKSGLPSSDQLSKMGYGKNDWLKYITDQKVGRAR